ncbi:MAG: hypothetical protein SFY32_03915 [Bacteroidota bacterium]|nr:hypothetical protein [Bacteroidota bacterium]
MVKLNTGSILTYFLYIPLMIVYHSIKEIKQILYALPLFVTMVVLIFYACDYIFNKRKYPLKLDRGLVTSLGFFLFACISSLIVAPETIYWFTFFRDIIIIAGPIIIFSYDVKYSHSDVVALLFTALVTYLIWIKFNVDFVFLKSIFESNYVVDNEYDYGTITGIFIIYFLYKKDYKMLLVAIVYLLFVNKRATFLGLLPSILAYYGGIRFFQLDKNKWALFSFLFAYYISFYIISINLPYFTSQFLALTGKQHIKLDDFLTGRMVMMNPMLPEIYNRGFLNYFFGNGIGQADYWLWKTVKHFIYNFKDKPINPHNDFMKLQFDIGLFGVIVYFFIMYYMYCVSNVGIMIFLFAVPLFLIENTLIYYINLILCCVVARADNYLEDKRKNLLKDL